MMEGVSPGQEKALEMFFDREERKYKNHSLKKKTEDKQMENQETKWEDISPGTWKPEKDGDSIEGVLLTKRTNVGVNNSNAYDLETKEGAMMIWGGAVLDSRMNFVNVGDKVRITYKGKQKNKKDQDVNIYQVEREKK